MFKNRFFLLFVDQEAVGAFHNNETQVNKYLKSMHIGTVEDNVDLDIAKDFRKLKDVAKSMVSNYCIHPAPV